MDEHFQLLFAFGMARVGADRDDTAGLQKLQGGEHGLTGGSSARRDGVIAAGKPAQIENRCRDTGGNGSGQFGMALAKQGYPIRRVVRFQQDTGGFQGAFLDIEGADMAFGADLFRQEQGVMAVSHGGIHHRVTGVHGLQQGVPGQIPG